VKSEFTSQPIQVVGEHPKYSFKKREIVVVVANDKDLFWIANDKKIALRYFHYTINWNDEKIYKKFCNGFSKWLGRILTEKTQ
jgi:hypothetical protein